MRYITVSLHLLYTDPVKGCFPTNGSLAVLVSGVGGGNSSCSPRLVSDGGGGGEGECSSLRTKSSCSFFRWELLFLLELELPSFSRVGSLSSALKVLVSLAVLKSGGGEVRVEVLPFPGRNASGRVGGSRSGAF